jgi:adenine-specific DNA-methyltransferase
MEPTNGFRRPISAQDNLLIRGDALNALTSLATLPEFEREYAGKVKLAYLDPPFNTQQSFLHYDDALEHSVWLTMMRDRLTQVITLLSPDGSVWVHCDDSEQAYLRVMMDELFGRKNFVASVIWQKIQGRNNSAQHFSTDHDYVLVFAKDAESWSRNRIDRTGLSDADFWNPDNDLRGSWRRSDLTASHAYSEGKYEVTGPHGDRFTPRGNRWWSVSHTSFEALRADNRLWWGKSGRTFPFRKRFEAELGGLVPTTIWFHDEGGDNREAKQEVTKLLGRDAIFATPKPERLLQRVIRIGSDPGDTVLDCFLGSGTTAAVAHKMDRRWVGVERSAVTLDVYTIPRLTKVLSGEDIGGITNDVGWEGGGGFRVLEVAPSMFEEVGGQVFLSGWAINRQLAEATAAQLRYDFDFDPPFCGRRGRSRLAVVDGLVNEGVVQLLVSALDEREQLVICGTAIDPAAGASLREIRPGSTVRKIPQSILQEYRHAVRWVQPELLDATAENAADAVEE